MLDEVPAGYVRISSAIGESRPVNVMIVPIVFEDQVLGVIEAGSLWPFTQVHRDFLEQLMEAIGVNVNTMIANARTDALLEQSQRLTAELQARQQELQRSNAELADKAALLAAQNRDIETKNAEIEQARQEIEERAKQLDQASRYKSQFLANMSHELRTPLNSLLVLARLLAQNPEGNLTAKQVEYATVIHSSGSDLLRLINDILDLTKVEAGKMEITPERFALAGLVEDLRGVFGPLTEEKRLRFMITTAPGVPAELVTDKQRLRQILYNLLSNAVKFTERGRVELHIDTAGRWAGGRGHGVVGGVLGDRHRHRHRPRQPHAASSPPSSRPTAPPAAATAAPAWAWPSAARSPPGSAARSRCAASSAWAAPSASTCRWPCSAARAARQPKGPPCRQPPGPPCSRRPRPWPTSGRFPPRERTRGWPGTGSSSSTTTPATPSCSPTCWRCTA